MVEIEKPRIECIDAPQRIPPTASMWSSPWSGATARPWATPCAEFCFLLCPAPRLPPSRSHGVQHEFSTIPGVKEDVTEIVLNVKRIIAKLHCAGRQDRLYRGQSASCEVTAGDIKADGEVEILNPELHICTLGPDATFNMEITLSHGRGYVPADRNKTRPDRHRRDSH